MEELRKDIKETSDRGKTMNDLVAIVDHYNHELSRILDKHAPEEERHVTLRKPTPWTSEDIKHEKQKRRRFEKRWRKIQLFVDENAFKRQNNRVNALLNAFSIKYNSDLVKKNANNPKSLFRIINRLLHRKGRSSKPLHTSESDLANEFQNYLARCSIPSFLNSNHSLRMKLRKLSPNKYSELNPIPTNLLRECIDEILPLFTKIINLSLQLGDMPTSLKNTIIKPILKKLGLELINKN